MPIKEESYNGRGTIPQRHLMSSKNFLAPQAIADILAYLHLCGWVVSSVRGTCYVKQRIGGVGFHRRVAFAALGAGELCPSRRAQALLASSHSGRNGKEGS